MFHKISNSNSIVQLESQISNGITKHVNASVKLILHLKRIHEEIRIYLKGIADYSKTVYNEIIYVMNILSTNVLSTVLANVRSTILTNSDDEKLRYKMECYILHIVLLVIILLFIIVIICDHHVKHRSKQKDIYTLTI